MAFCETLAVAVIGPHSVEITVLSEIMVPHVTFSCYCWILFFLAARNTLKQTPSGFKDKTSYGDPIQTPLEFHGIFIMSSESKYAAAIEISNSQSDRKVHVYDYECSFF